VIRPNEEDWVRGSTLECVYWITFLAEDVYEATFADGMRQKPRVTETAS